MKLRVALGLLAVLVLAIFNLVFFSVVDNMPVSCWICWGVIHAAGALFVAAARSAKMSGDGLVHAYPKVYVSLSLFATMAVAGMLVGVWNPKSWTMPAAILSLLAFADLFVYVSLGAAEEKTLEDGKQDAADRFFVQSCAERLSAARSAQTNAVARKQIEKAYDAIRGAQVTTVPAVTDIETRIDALVSKLCNDSEAGNMAAIAATVAEIISAVRKREMEIRLSQR